MANKYKKFVATAATATLVASAIVPVASAAHEDTAGHQFESYIKDATELGLFKDGGKFNPQNKLTRKHVVTIVGRYLEDAGKKPAADYETNPAFTDLGTTDAEYLRLASVVKEAGIFSGDNGKINGAQNISRQHMAKVLNGLAEAVTGTSLVEAAKEIEDVKVSDLDAAGASYRDAIQALADFGITTVEKFNPKGEVTRGQFAKFIMETIGAVKKIEAGIKPTPEKVEEALKAVDEAVKALPAVASITKENAADAQAKADAVNKAVKDAEELLAKADLTDAKKEEAQKKLDAAKAAAKAVADKVAEVTKPVSELVVDSVSAANAGELQIKFNQPISKSSVIDTNGQLKAGVIKVGATALDATTYTAYLSDDSKTLTILADGTTFADWTTSTNVTNVVTVNANIVTHKDHALLTAPEYIGSYSLTDTTRATVTAVTRVANDTVKLTFSEPVKTATFGYSYVDGTANTTLTSGSAPTVTWAADKKSVTIKFASATLLNKDIQIASADITDYKGNVSLPYTTTTQKVLTDVTGPKFVSAVAKSATKVEVTFDEEVEIADASKIKLNGLTGVISGVAAGSVNVTQKATDKKVLVLELDSTNAITTSATLSIAVGAVTDASANDNSVAAQTVYFNVDQAAPTVQSTQVVYLNGNNVLKVKFNEAVTIPTATALNLKYIDAYGVEKSITIQTPQIAVNGTDDTVLDITLNDGASAAPVNLNYYFDLPEGYVVDGFNNKVAKSKISFTNTPTVSPVSKLTVTSVTPGISAADGLYADIVFPELVDPATATNVANYAIEGAQIEKAVILKNDPSDKANTKVRVYIKAGTVKVTGNYNFTINGVKAYTASSLVANEVVNKQFTENVAPTVKSAVIADTTSGNSTITLTFSEALAVAGSTSTNDFELFVDGVKSNTTVTTASITSNATTVSLTVDTDLNALLAQGKKLELRPQSTIDITDANLNTANTGNITIK